MSIVFSEIIYEGYSNDPKNHFIDFNYRNTQSMIQYFYLINNFFNQTDEELIFEKYIETISQEELDAVINNLSLIEIYPHTKTLAYFYKNSDFTLGKTTYKDFENYLLSLNLKYWKLLIQGDEYSKGYFRKYSSVSSVEILDFFLIKNLNKEYLIKKDIKDFLKNSLTKKFNLLNSKEKVKFEYLFEQSISFLKKIHLGDGYGINASEDFITNIISLTRIIKIIKELENEIDFRMFSTIIVAITHGSTWIGNGRKKNLETFAEIFEKVDNKIKFLDWFKKVIFEYDGFSLNNKMWVSEINSINFNLNPKLAFNLLTKNNKNKLSIIRTLK